MKAYDHADHIKALGLPFNEPLKHCQTPGGAPSTACNALSYNDAAVPAFRERFEYDHVLRLTGAEEVGVGMRSYSYDDRGNRTSEANWARSMTSALGNDAFPDQLASVAAPPAAGESWQLMYSYDYDADGRVKAIHSPPYLTPSPSGLTDVKMEFGYGDPTVGGIDAVFNSVTLSNAFDGGPTYDYYYDAQSRRWRKVYPTLKADEFFYDSGHLLLEDRGNDALDSQTPVYPIDEYVWLDGRPVAYLRSNFDASWNRLNDLTGSYKRNGEEAACGLYFLVTDHIGKPAVVLDSQHRISGAAVEEDPFGEANSRPLAGDTHHPMIEGQAGPLATIDLGRSRGLHRQVRVKFAMVDSLPGAVTFDSSGVTLAGGSFGRPYAGPQWSDWEMCRMLKTERLFCQSLLVSRSFLGFRRRISNTRYVLTGRVTRGPVYCFRGQYADGEQGCTKIGIGTMIQRTEDTCKSSHFLRIQRASSKPLSMRELSLLHTHMPTTILECSSTRTGTAPGASTF